MADPDELAVALAACLDTARARERAARADPAAHLVTELIEAVLSAVEATGPADGRERCFRRALDQVRSAAGTASFGLVLNADRRRLSGGGHLPPPT
ncbi:hypothetical protein [Actinosynnema mirum]|uniref:Uncharacterized protein n=1 Tax=Actinosynnema mirum (strain ATCC 29888 / DSM 43827 / JCM 3225 / NBRC 14064 / NCIMB 13271 / NRRL B-12336 / IMRU 3971 / 101) TaxID=446462 RepID=C6WEK1_ACTMD|nr:hypothetical protein [Actinosynnema mirum]ACU37801.1 hypothetical protein Amir_3932 [Actinosynnema mirum DSM 43827]